MSGFPFGRRCFQLRRFNPTYGTYAVWFATAPTGPGGNIELPNYFFKLHLERGIKTYRDSIDISLLWSEGYTHIAPVGYWSGKLSVIEIPIHRRNGMGL